MEFDWAYIEREEWHHGRECGRTRRTGPCTAVGWRSHIHKGSLAMFVDSAVETIASTALPTIVGDLGGVEMMQWISTAYIW